MRNVYVYHWTLNTKHTATASTFLSQLPNAVPSLFPVAIDLLLKCGTRPTICLLCLCKYQQAAPGVKSMQPWLFKMAYIAFLKFNDFRSPILLTDRLVTLQSELLLLCGEIWDGLRPNTHRRPAQPPLSFLTSTSLSQRALWKERHVGQTCQRGHSTQSKWVPFHYCAFIIASIGYLIAILTPSSAKAVCKEKKSWSMSDSILQHIVRDTERFCTVNNW